MLHQFMVFNISNQPKNDKYWAKNIYFGAGVISEHIFTHVTVQSMCPNHPWPLVIENWFLFWKLESSPRIWTHDLWLRSPSLYQLYHGMGRVLLWALKRELTFATTQQSHSTDIFTAENFLPLAELFKLQEGILVYKVNSGQYLLSNFLTDGHVDRHYRLRNNDDLRIPLHATTHEQQVVHYRAIKTWNNLPDNLRSSSSLHSFKTKLKLMLTLET